jgi:cell pole-organizing protein PopZ
MEEILASIRRIIEDNDSGRKQPGDADVSRADVDAATDRTVIEVDAFRAELRTPHVETRTLPVEPPTPPVELRAAPAKTLEPEPLPRDVPEKKQVTLAEVQAQITAEARVAPAARWSPEKPPVSDRLAAEERVRIAIDAARAKRDDAVLAASDKAEAAMAGPLDERAPGPAAAAKAAAPVAKPIDIEEKAFASVPAVNRPVPADSAASRPAILSERAERKIAASFGELSEAFAARSKKTFDEMAEEMMRPMLQDWLDNNLPLLVERLVREEIERVARGV